MTEDEQIKTILKGYKKILDVGELADTMALQFRDSLNDGEIDCHQAQLRMEIIISLAENLSNEIIKLVQHETGIVTTKHIYNEGETKKAGVH